MICHACIPHVPVARVFGIPALRLASSSALRHTHSFSLNTHTQYQLSQRPRSLSAREALRTRAFSSTPQRRAEEDPALRHTFAEQQKLLKLFQEKPEVLENLKSFMTLLQQNGVDIHSGTMPSKTEMFRLLMKSEVRESAMKMAGAFQEAGINLQSKEMMQSLMSMQQMFKDK